MKQSPKSTEQPQQPEQSGGTSPNQKPGKGNSRTSRAQQNRLVVVGTGVSDGGLEAARKLLLSLESTDHLALVFVQNRDSTEKNLLAALGATSAKFAVVEIQGRKKLKAKTAYICPPDEYVEIKNGFVRLSKPENTQSKGPIDHFFYSLASGKGVYRVAIMLSGMGTDGTMGLKAMSDQGGFSLALSTDSEGNETIPHSASPAGVADFVLSPEGIAQEVKSYVRHLQEVKSSGAEQQRVAKIEEAIPVITEHLMKATSHNFLHYKTSTLLRRIQRRMQVHKFLYVEEYVDFLQHHKDEVQALFRELLIGVTHFFRDPDAFAALKLQVLPKIFGQRHAEDCLRIWLAGCANGAEAYTMAILCLEVMEDIDDPCNVQIFATDINDQALEIARRGVYPVGIAETVSPERLGKYFTRRGKKYVVNQDIRNVVMFSTHNLISDPPFSNQDLIVCRNLLIYLGPHLQNKLMPLFHYALRPGGYLFLGPSESTSTHGELFRPVDTSHSISQRKGTAAKRAPSISLRQDQLFSFRRATKQPEQQPDLTAIAQRIVLDEFAPKYVVVDDSGRIINTSPGIDKYLRISGGDYENNIVRLAVGGLRIGLRAALSEAKKIRRRVDHDQMSIRVGEKTQKVMLTVQPMPRLGEDEPLHMVVFQDVGLPFDRGHTDAHFAAEEPDADALIAQLENELEATRHGLDKSLQDLEAANEELQSSNEELLSMNEELQSANEELETSKEQIRSSSEVVTQAKTDLENLLRSSQIATVFLDEAFCIRGFTPAFTEIYQLVSTDIGRPLNQFVPNVADMPPLPDPASVSKNGAVEHTIQTKSGRAYLRRVLPYCLVSGETKGIVVTFADVTELRASEDMLKRSLKAARLNAFYADMKTMKLRQRGPLQEVLGLTEHSSLKEYFNLIHPQDLPVYQHLLQSRAPDAALYSSTHRVKTEKGDYIWLREMGEVAFDNGNSAIRLSGTYQDVTAEQAYRLNLEAREKQLSDALDRLDISLSASGAAAWSWDPNKNIPIVSDTMKQMFGFAADACPGYEDFISRIHSDDRQRIDKANLDVLHHGGLYEEEYRICLPSGDMRWLRANGRVVLSAEGRLENFFGVAFDITEQKNRVMEANGREAHLRRVIDNTLNFIGVLDYQGTLLESNKTAVEAAGIAREEVIGKPFWECFWWSWDDNVATRLFHAIKQAQQGEVVRYDETVRMANDSLMVIDFVLAPVRDDAGKITHIIPSGTDISDRKQFEEDIRLSEERLYLAAKSAGFATFSVDLETQSVIWSDEFLEMLGLPESACNSIKVGEVPEFVHPNDRDKVEEYLFKVLHSDTATDHQLDHRVIRSDKTERFVRMQSRIIFQGVGDDRRKKMIIGTVLDITDQHAFEQKLESSKNVAEAANRSKSEFLANMSHEIRTPMSAIMGYADILSTSLVDSHALSCVSIIRNNGQYLLQIINDILDLSKIEAGKLEVTKSSVKTDQLLAGVASLMQVRATEKSLNFSVEIAQEIPSEIHTDPTRLRQVLINLIGNAIKFTAKGSVKLLVSYHADSGAPDLCFDVIDTGIGISEEEQKLIFEPFMQSDAGADRNYSGSGLGLTISKRLTEMLGGKITLTSVAGQGTIFTVKIGLGEHSRVSLISQDSLANADNHALAEVTGMPNLLGRILVVDDQQEIRFLAQHAIENAGGQVETADNGQEALDAIRIANEQDNPFDILVIDMQMPVLDGYEATRRLRASGFTRPIIALTANAMEGDREKSLQAGCNEHLIKPLNAPAFICLLHHYLAAPSELEEVKATRILIVDDGRDMALALATLLELKGYQTEIANDGASGLILAQSCHPEVVLLDLGLPDLNGFDVMKKMKAINALSRTKFIALTGQDNKETSLKAGFDYHILKPVDIDDLSEWITKTCA